VDHDVIDDDDDDDDVVMNLTFNHFPKTLKTSIWIKQLNILLFLSLYRLMFGMVIVVELMLLMEVMSELALLGADE
jgi:hypothetical protein